MTTSPNIQAEQISVLICAYNRNQYMDAVMQSIAQQTLRPAEIIVVDDGSEPPVTIPAGIEGVRVVRIENNAGVANARNVGIKAARFPFIAFLDTDDTWRPTKLARQMARMRNAPDDVFGIFTGFQRRGRQVRAGVVRTPEATNWYHYFLMGVRCGPGSTLMFRREAALEAIKFDAALVRYEDWDWLLNITRSGKYRFLSIDDPLADVELTGKPNPELAAAGLERIAQRHLPLMRTTTEKRLFHAGLSMERAAIARWSGNHLAFVGHALKSISAPEIIKREIKLTLNKS